MGKGRGRQVTKDKEFRREKRRLGEEKEGRMELPPNSVSLFLLSRVTFLGWLVIYESGEDQKDSTDF